MKDIEFLSDPNARELRIGANPSLSEGIVAIGIDRLSRRYPSVVFQVAPAGTQKPYDELREWRIELAIARMPGVVAEDDIDQHALFEEPLVVVAGTDNPWVRRRRITLADLVNEPWTWAASGTMFPFLAASGL